MYEERVTQEKKCSLKGDKYMEIDEHCYIYINPGYEYTVYRGYLYKNNFNTWIWKFMAQIKWGRKALTLRSNNTSILQRIH